MNRTDHEIGPREVAEMLGIPVSRARRYMKAGRICSHVSESADGREYTRTFESEVEAYRRRAGAETPVDVPTEEFSPIRLADVFA